MTTTNPLRFQSTAEAVAAFLADRPFLEDNGISWAPGVEPLGYLAEDGSRHNYAIAMDALPTLSTDPNSAVPAMLTTLIDPQVYEVLFAPNMAAEIMGERKEGTWLNDTAMFPVAEATGEVSTYGDFNANGRAGVNTNWPQVQAYLFQLIKQYGERELERAGLARINWVSSIDKAAALNLNKYLNLTYFFGVSGLQNYGLINNPFLSAALTPATKAAGGTAWLNYTTGQIIASANEIYNDILAVYQQLVTQNAGLVNAESAMTLALSPASEVGLHATNTFNVNVEDLLKKNFKNLRVKTAVQYGALSTTNPQGAAAGNTMQLIVDEVEGQKTGFCAYSEKMRSFPIIRLLSAFQQKAMSGSWGTVIRYPAGLAQMVGI